MGRPLTFMLNNRGVTVTICNEHTRDLAGALAGVDADVAEMDKATTMQALLVIAKSKAGKYTKGSAEHTKLTEAFQRNSARLKGGAA